MCCGALCCGSDPSSQQAPQTVNDQAIGSFLPLIRCLRRGSARPPRSAIVSQRSDYRPTTPRLVTIAFGPGARRVAALGTVGFGTGGPVRAPVSEVECAWYRIHWFARPVTARTKSAARGRTVHLCRTGAAHAQRRFRSGARRPRLPRQCPESGRPGRHRADLPRAWIGVGWSPGVARSAQSLGRHPSERDASAAGGPSRRRTNAANQRKLTVFLGRFGVVLVMSGFSIPHSVVEAAVGVPRSVGHHVGRRCFPPHVPRTVIGTADLVLRRSDQSGRMMSDADNAKGRFSFSALLATQTYTSTNAQ